jgi:uncharacterized protein (DUF1778 family)
VPPRSFNSSRASARRVCFRLPKGVVTAILLVAFSGVDFTPWSMYHLNTYKERLEMPRPTVEDNSRMSLRIRPEEKALLLRAVALKHTDLTEFVLRHAVRAAKAVIDEADRVQLSGRDSLRVLDLLENPPAPNGRLMAAARALAKRPRP